MFATGLCVSIELCLGLSSTPQHLIDSSRSHWPLLLPESMCKEEERGEKTAAVHSAGSIEDSGNYLGRLGRTASCKTFLTLMKGIQVKKKFGLYNQLKLCEWECLNI